LDAKEGRIEARVSCIPAVGGFEAITLRLINAAEPVPLDQIGADLEQKTMLDQLLASPHGLLLVCGPTGSGKTTTLHSMLSQLNTPGRKIWTVEDPVEIVQDGLVQTQAMPKIGYGFDTALRAFMRADPDVIMVGEVRDAATASAALEASLTGHFVLTTLHTNSACESAVRMLDLGADQFALADAIRGIVAQRLARKLCSCSYKRDATQQEIDEMAREHFTAMGEPRSSRSDRTRWLAETTKRQGRPIEVREPVGCDLCRGSGHKGRVGILEVLPASQAVKKALSNKESAADLLRIALSEGFKPLRARAIELACAGVISLSEARGISL
jgi:type II secretory ATPase GspE/PulE/Tfp pilus assembly ATPase PilB-like protein